VAAGGFAGVTDDLAGATGGFGDATGGFGPTGRALGAIGAAGFIGAADFGAAGGTFVFGVIFVFGIGAGACGEAAGFDFVPGAVDFLAGAVRSFLVPALLAAGFPCFSEVSLALLAAGFFPAAGFLASLFLETDFLADFEAAGFFFGLFFAAPADAVDASCWAWSQRSASAI
jgi:hypothetical protein